MGNTCGCSMKKIEFPVEEKSRIDFAVQQSFGISHWKFVSVLNNGLSGASVYKINIKNRPYVIKLDDISDKMFDLNRVYVILEKAALRDIAPPVYFTDTKQGVVLMKYIDAKPFPEVTPDSARQLASFFRQLHDAPSFSTWKSNFEKLDYLYQQLPTDYQQSSLVQQGISKAAYLKIHLSDPADIRPCHCDVHANNLLFDGRKYYLIDWQLATLENFYFDLAGAVGSFNFYDEVLYQLLLKKYFGREPDHDESEKFVLMRKFLEIYYGIAMIFFSSRNIKLLPLSENDIALLPEYFEFNKSIRENKISLSCSEIQQKFGYLLLKTALG